MSQVHNLFRTSKPQVDGHSTSPIQPPVEIVAGYRTQPEIPVVTAHIRPQDRLVFHTDPGSPGADRFRFLRMRLKQLWPAGKPKSLLITSPLPHEGKSTTALNLASALCEQGKFRVLLIEADLHHVCLARQLGLGKWPGLVDCLGGNINPMDAIRRVEPLQWCLLPAGDSPQNPTELLHTPALPAVLNQVVPNFDWVLIDSPPVLPVTDPLFLCQHVGGTLLVVRAGSTPDEAVEQTIISLGRQNLVGVVLNGADRADRLYAQYGYYRDHAAAKAE